MKYLFAFGSTHKALKAESLLKADEIPYLLLPAPKELSTYCALVIEIIEQELEPACSILKQGETEPKSIYKKENGDYVKV
ncbi:MAG: DUF3343 domain-containing protein [Thermodesulfobacteriota bacterium]